MFRALFVSLTLCAFAGHAQERVQRSSTGDSKAYREVCIKALVDDQVFANFRSIEGYFHAVECGQGGEFAQYLRTHATQKTLSLIPQFRTLDTCGNPVRNLIPDFGYFSGTTLRYILVADHITRLFNLPPYYTVAEIGAGFGGQAYILSVLAPFASYMIYDLPEVEKLIEKVAKHVGTAGLYCVEPLAPLPIPEVDLCISNYALSECDRATQIDYIQRVVSKAKRGYLLFNNCSSFDHLSLSELIALLQSYGISPKVLAEPVFSYTGNVLITWDKTK